MLGAIPLLIIPLVAYNLGILLPQNAAPWTGVLFSLPMMSGGVWSMTSADLLVLAALVILFFEIVKATRTSRSSVTEHLLSTLVLIGYLVEFLLVRGAATSLFFTLMVITLVDVLAGFSVAIRSAGRDISLN